MIKKIGIIMSLCLSMTFYSCDQLAGLAGDLLGPGGLTQAEIGQGLKEALKIGITSGAQKLSLEDGYLKSPYKILLPDEVRKVTDKLATIPGFDMVEQKLVEKLNRGAEDAAKSAAPIFKDAITEMTFQDATKILMGEKNAATSYLTSKTRTKLYNEFQPVILNSLNKVGAADYWNSLVTKYNSIPFVNKVNPDLDDYVTNEALDGLFNMVEKKELSIRTNISERTSDLLRRVFAQQDK